MIKPYYQDEAITIFHGNSLDVLKGLPSESVHCCVTDPPYELGFMGKAWDKSGISYNVDLWKEVLRVLKPGAFLLAFGGSRTYHRITCAIEDAGFEIRDQIMWIYGSGFPKSLDVSKAIDKAAGAEREILRTEKFRDIRNGHGRGYGDGINASEREKPEYLQHPITVPTTDSAKQWEGWGTALKPAHEPICVARKPFKNTVAANVLKHGTGAMNIDGCRVELNGDYKSSANGRPSQTGLPDNYDPNNANNPSDIGRWPANIIHDGSEEVLECFPNSKGQQGDVRGTEPSYTGDENTVCFGKFNRVAFRGKRTDEGSAARFFYTAKASPSERGKGNNHPTVKPVALMAYLVRLVCPPAGIVLDPFFGSGTTGVATRKLGVKCIGIEQEEHHIKDISIKRFAQGVLL